jgi:hypothetical protein
VLLGAIEAAVTQHRLVTSERVLLEQTLHGSIQTLVDVLALTNPVLFGRSLRIKQRVAAMAETLALDDRWQVEVTAMLSPLGCAALPAEVAEKVYEGRPLSSDEDAMVARVPAITEQLLGHIPRLDTVRAILACFARAATWAPSQDEAMARIALRAQLLRVATDFETLLTGGMSSGQAIGLMKSRLGRYDPLVLSALADITSVEPESTAVREVMLSGLRVGMVISDDVTSAGGLLIAAKGYVVTETFLTRVLNSRRDPVREPVRIVIDRVPSGAAQLDEECVQSRA